MIAASRYLDTAWQAMIMTLNDFFIKYLYLMLVDVVRKGDFDTLMWRINMDRQVKNHVLIRQTARYKYV